MTRGPGAAVERPAGARRRFAIVQKCALFNLTHYGSSPPPQVPLPNGLLAHLGANIFTDIAFEKGLALHQLDTKHVFVAAASGAVFQARPWRHHPVYLSMHVGRAVGPNVPAFHFQPSNAAFRCCRFTNQQARWKGEASALEGASIVILTMMGPPIQH